MKQPTQLYEILKPFLENPVNSFIFTFALYIFGYLYGHHQIAQTGMFLICLLITVDWLSGTSAAKSDGIDTSQYGIEGVKRTMVLLIIPAIAHQLDEILQFESFIFYFAIASLMRSIVRSVIANIYRAGWTKWIPVNLLEWLVSWVSDEIASKEARAKQRKEAMKKEEK